MGEEATAMANTTSSEQMYELHLDNAATPPFISLPQSYVGTKEALLKVSEKLKMDGIYEETSAGIQAYFKGNSAVKHHIAFQEIPVLQTCRILNRSEMQIGERAWDHMNVWDCPYHMRFRSAEISQILVDKNSLYQRYMLARIVGLEYSATDDEWRSVGNFIFGHRSVVETEELEDGTWTFRNILYVPEDSSDSLDEQNQKMNDKNALVFDALCDEIFGDG